jgi:hypothetical protein
MKRLTVLVALVLLASPLVIEIPSVVLLGVLPSCIAIVVVMISGRSMARRFGVTQLLPRSLTMTLSTTALLILKRRIIDRAWPTYLPYLLMAVTIPIVIVQADLADPRRRAT